jgi:hypothetical protein
VTQGHVMLLFFLFLEYIFRDTRDAPLLNDDQLSLELQSPDI